MPASLQKIFFGLSVALLIPASMARSDEVLRMQPGFAMTKKVPGADDGKFVAIIGDPKIADFTYGPQNTFMFVGKKQGTTNIVVLENGSGAELYSATIEVGDATHRVTNHNKVLLNSFTVYRCTPACEFVNEVTVSEPAPLPRGYSNLQSSATIQSNTTQSPSSPTVQPTPP